MWVYFLTDPQMRFMAGNGLIRMFTDFSALLNCLSKRELLSETVERIIKSNPTGRVAKDTECFRLTTSKIGRKSKQNGKVIKKCTGRSHKMSD